MLPSFVSFGALFKPIKMQGKNVGVIYSYEAFLLTILDEIE